jgi:hypothetical protein
MFELLAEVEGRVHGKSPEEVHFHEVGAVDSIVDIIGACIGFDYFGADRIISNRLNLGGGTVKTDHGELAVPPPAVSELIVGIPVFGDNSGFELTTPTGALIVRTFADEFGPMPAMVIEKTGYGAGTRDIKGRANVLKIYLGETETGYLTDTVTMLETQIDDMTPEAFGYLMERLFDIPVLDAYYTPVQMKKNRPGILLTVIQKPENTPTTLDVIFRNSTTLGVRRRETGRYILERVSASVKTKYGEISVKVSARSDYSPMIAPEYEDCNKAAQKHNVSLQDVHLEAINEYKKREGK